MAEKGIIKILHQIGNIIEKIIEVCVGIFISAIGIAVFIGVVGRNVNIPVVWLDEVSTYCCIWATFFGFALACKYDMLSNVDVLLHWLPKSARKYFQIFWMAFGAVFMGIVMYSCKDYLSFVYSSGTLSAQLRIPLAYVYAGPAIGYGFGIYFLIVNMIDSIRSLKTGKEGVSL